MGLLREYKEAVEDIKKDMPVILKGNLILNLSCVILAIVNGFFINSRDISSFVNGIVNISLIFNFGFLIKVHRDNSKKDQEFLEILDCETKKIVKLQLEHIRSVENIRNMENLK